MCAHITLVGRQLEPYELLCLYHGPLRNMCLWLFNMYTKTYRERQGLDLIESLHYQSLHYFTKDVFSSFPPKWIFISLHWREKVFLSYHVYCFYFVFFLFPPLASLWSEGAEWGDRGADVSSPALKKLVKIRRETITIGVYACYATEAGRFYEGTHNRMQQIKSWFWQQFWKW